MNLKRYRVIDFIRGLAVLNMIVYHGLWDAVVIFNADIPWFRGEGAGIWQQFICCTFIFISGFCWSMSRKHIKKGLMIIGCSLLISVVTAVLMPENLIIFGVLSLIGSCMLIMIPLDKAYSKCSPYIVAIISLLLFVFAKDINAGVIGIGDSVIFKLPSEWYANLFTAYMGFPPASFISADYFSVFPWVFLYQAGYFIYIIFEKNNLLRFLVHKTLTPVELVGRNALLLYMLHQPVTYAVVWCTFKLL